MNKDIIIITNNDKIKDKYNKYFEVDYLDISYIDILYKVKDKIYDGFVLLTHPMAGSLKPNQTPYKSVMLSSKDNLIISNNYTTNISLIENSLLHAKTFLKNKSTPKWDEKSLNDFKTIDLSLIENVVINHQEIFNRR